MYILVVEETTPTDSTVMFAQNDYDIAAYSQHLLKKYPDHVVNLYKLSGKFTAKVNMKITEYIVNEKGEVYPK